MAQILKNLADPSTTIGPADLMELSEIQEEPFGQFKLIWASTNCDQRSSIITRLLALAEDHIDLDFSTIFKQGLDDENASVRANSIAGLWEVEERSIINPLIQLLTNDPETSVRVAAAQALGRFALLGEFGKLLDRDAARVKDTLLEIVGDITESIEVRRRALEAVAPITSPSVHEAILTAYKTKIPEWQTTALMAMGSSCNSRWLATLVDELENELSDIRYEAALALGEIGQTKAVVHLIPHINDSEPDVQFASIQSLGSIGGPIAKRALSQAAKSDDDNLANLAKTALATLNVDETPLDDMC